MGPLAELDDDSIKDFIMCNPFAIIDFWGSDCSACRMIAPFIEGLAGEYTGKVCFGKYNVDGKWDKVAELYAVLGLPSILVYMDGVLAARFSGNLDIRLNLKKCIEKNLRSD